MSKENGHAKETAARMEETSSLKTAAEIAAGHLAALPAASPTMVAPAVSAVSPPAMISQQELDALRVEAAKAKENLDRLLRSQADFDNYRKRVARERQELIRSANEKLLQELFTPLDHFEMGLQSVQPPNEVNANDALRQGMEMVLSQFQQFLKSQGVVEIQASGQMFDPAQHEAVAHESADAPEGQVLRLLRKGYRCNDRLLRAASVVVSKGKLEAPPAAPTTEAAD